ncbi:MAG: hypothetical protein EBE86_021285 [Hormoscilla sp. GUM202]|nr:hypothetical protein [Hormoscilla sp. GUM202]
MRIYISSNHQYPAKVSGTASQHTTDLLAKGLGELGHDVFYDLRQNEILEPLPDSVNQVRERMFDVDILGSSVVSMVFWQPIKGVSLAGQSFDAIN